mmetsp:Transcript_66866/g.184403  ORF Transcript_66866/g.184403 Transcript_66866/m.184403 type:complete len:233 (+) Transcript_66866:265-963(+)|eukprot:CAMPEP_0119505808 /NCGR_PEP_ID=MMETSP1344-20130328/26251_1 /TAXON_ID=236787 /ORGANISM="Florenciella parvula, Strain CCMP2471" /LENGTH=232 /DNA_ID=CAMNT_0007542309 /DNA_START=86 /DNA_END=784 /DNA_ORIENTATION=+
MAALLVLRAVALITVYGATSTVGSCPADISIYRTSSVTGGDDGDGLDLMKMNGLWYEQAYIDLAQVGESCQVFNNTYLGEASEDLGDGSDGVDGVGGVDGVDGHVMSSTSGIDQKFHVKYGPIPYTLPLHYDTTDQTGVFQRYAQYPGGKFLKFPSVVVDAVLSDDGTEYTSLSEYLCYMIGPIEYVEIRIATRGVSVTNDELEEMEDVLRGVGIQYDNLTYVDHNGCDPWP